MKIQKLQRNQDQTLNKKQSKKGILGNVCSCKGSVAVFKVQDLR